jgi:hypothetical protein
MWNSPVSLSMKIPLAVLEFFNACRRIDEVFLRMSSQGFEHIYEWEESEFGA